VGHRGGGNGPYDWKIDRARYVAVPVMSDGSEVPRLKLRGLFKQFLLEAR